MNTCCNEAAWIQYPWLWINIEIQNISLHLFTINSKIKTKTKTEIRKKKNKTEETKDKNKSKNQRKKRRRKKKKEKNKYKAKQNRKRTLCSSLPLAKELSLVGHYIITTYIYVFPKVKYIGQLYQKLNQYLYIKLHVISHDDDYFFRCWWLIDIRICYKFRFWINFPFSQLIPSSWLVVS